MMNFGLNILQLVKGLIPLKIRGDRFMAWIGALVAPIQTLNVTFASLVDDLRYKQKFNGQVIYLEHILNDQFDPNGRDVYIDDPSEYILENYIFNVSEDPQTLILYNKSEGQPPLYLYNLDEVAANNDFIVYVPDTITFNSAVEVQMRAIINRYRHAGKRYSFEIYTP